MALLLPSTIAVKQKDGSYFATTFDWESGFRTSVTYDLAYINNVATWLTKQNALVVTQSNLEVITKDFDRHFANRREHELAVARAGAAKSA